MLDLCWNKELDEFIWNKVSVNKTLSTDENVIEEEQMLFFVISNLYGFLLQNTKWDILKNIDNRKPS